MEEEKKEKPLRKIIIETDLAISSFILVLIRQSL